MTAKHTTTSFGFGSWFSALRQRRRRWLGERIMNDLPPSLQKDIGWVPSAPPRRR